MSGTGFRGSLPQTACRPHSVVAAAAAAAAGASCPPLGQRAVVRWMQPQQLRHQRRLHLGAAGTHQFMKLPLEGKHNRANDHCCQIQQGGNA
eukprot:1160202-Pelagomonas_calceolata.AAC.3